jgi:autotransporter translocation and assembly factor TamB
MSDISMDRLSGARIRTRKPKLIDKRDDIFAFDVQLHGKRNLEARNNLFDMDLAIDDVDRPLRLVGTNQTIGFLGRVIGKRGQVRFGGKRFDMKYADVDFKDPDRPDNPNFRVTADGQIRDWKVTITAEGTIEEYELKLSAQPYLSKEDVIFVILTGMTKAENRQFGAATLTPLLSQLGPGGKSMPVEFRIYNAYSEQAGTETTRIALGRWVTPDIWVSVSSSVSQERDVEAELDYKINDQFSLSTDYDDDTESAVGNIGLDLKFRLEF